MNERGINDQFDEFKKKKLKSREHQSVKALEQDCKEEEKGTDQINSKEAKIPHQINKNKNVN